MTSHETANYGFVAVDDLVFQAFEECSLKPSSAAPKTTLAPTTTMKTTTPKSNIIFCDFQQDTCGWEISGVIDEFFSWNRTNGKLLSEIGLQPNVDHEDSDSGNCCNILAQLPISTTYSIN